MHDRAIVIWTIEIVCHLFPEVMHLVCQNTKDEGHTTHLARKITYLDKGFVNAVTHMEKVIVHPDLA